MSRDPIDPADPFDSLCEGYVNGGLDDGDAQRLEDRLTHDAAARERFVRYVRMHADLTLELRARRATDVAIDSIRPRDTRPSPHVTRRAGVALGVVAGLLIAVALGRAIVSAPDESVAWLVNAQNCSWAGGEPPVDLRPGKSFRLDRGLAEVQFRCGARVVVEGPARLEFLSPVSARLHVGKLTASVPPEASGFEILCPQGKVIDLGTEFGVSVSQSGAADVYVFEGRVEAYPSGARKGEKVDLTRHQGARLAEGSVTMNAAEPTPFVREIVPSEVFFTRDRSLTFTESVVGTIRDAAGVGTGLTHRLPGTGEGLGPNDENLRVVPALGRLELTTTNSDLNTQFRLRRGEYVGLRLSDLGFTGTEDFEVSATFPSIPALDGIGQFGLYAGARGDRNIRGGVLISEQVEGQYTQFLVNNPDGRDVDTTRVGLSAAGTSLKMVLRRTTGKFTLSVENQTVGFSTTLVTRHPDFLDAEKDLYVGLFGANTQSDQRRTLAVKKFRVSVKSPTPPAVLPPGPR